MREHVSQSKKATTASFSIPSLKHRIPGFGLDSSQASPQAVPLVQPLHKSLTHDISRIPLRNPQAKLSISQPGDKYEQEADSVAQQVMQRIAQPVNRQSIQPEAMPEGEELQMKSLANSIRPLQRQEMPEDEEELQMKSLENSTLQREVLPEDEEELQMKSMVQRQTGMAVAPDLETSINQARGSGQAMAENIRHPMEVAFGADFSGVKVHTDGQSDQLNRSIQARAFTTGQDVFFRQGEYNPGSRGGQELLAHELTHVVQQNGGAAVQRVRSQSRQKQSETKQSKIGINKGGIKKRGGKKGRGGAQQPSKRATRSSTKTFDLKHPTLDFSSNYQGVTTQILNAKQRISFKQQATLFKPEDAPLSTASYYNFRQEVQDGFGSHPMDTGHPLTQNFVQDGPFRPNYNNENIISTSPSIIFNDNPGFSGELQIPNGDWLNWYEVRFRWKVELKPEFSDDHAAHEWISPEVTHRVNSLYNQGQDVEVQHNSSLNQVWNVQIP